MRFKHDKQRKAVMAKLKNHPKEVSCQPVMYDKEKRRWVRVKVIKQ